MAETRTFDPALAFVAVLEKKGISPSELEVDHKGTICPRRQQEVAGAPSAPLFATGGPIESAERTPRTVDSSSSLPVTMSPARAANGSPPRLASESPPRLASESPPRLASESPPPAADNAPARRAAGGGRKAADELQIRSVLRRSRLSIVRDAAGDSPFRIGKVLGQGGYGVVREAEQVVLGRGVAVKTVNARRDAPEHFEELVREAWITGGLEHPNIVPVHTIWLSGDQPMVAMKRIEGVSWSEILRNVSTHAEFGIEDRLEWHLQTLMQVCRALHFAHTRGILHRDLKPTNVMIGRFGEVYVLDWGLAVGFGATAPDWMPHVESIESIAGTPHYMSPEMAVGDGDRMGPWSDVYQLGALLHEIVTMTRRHQGSTPMEILDNAYISAPVAYSGDVPVELAAICNRATARDPEARFQSAEEFRLAVAGFLQHRTSAALLESARDQLAKLEVVGNTDEAPRQTAVQRLFYECDFALRKSSEAWPENPGIAPLRAQLARARVAHALALRHVDEAADYLDELDETASDLRKGLTDLRDSLAHEARLQHLGKGFDPRVGVYARAGVVYAIGLLWFIPCLLLEVGTRLGWFALSKRVIVTSAFAGNVVLSLVLLRFGGVFWRSLTNRRLLGLYFFFAFVAVVLWFALLDTLSLEALMLMSLVLCFLFLGATTIAFDPRLSVTLIPVAIGCMALSVWPSWCMLITGLAAGGAGMLSAWITSRAAQSVRRPRR